MLVVIGMAYSNTLQVPWHFDDLPNITRNARLHLQDLSPRSLLGTFYAGFDERQQPQARLFRPVANLTFALNWFWGRDRVLGYHIVNIALHWLGAVILFLTVRSLCGAPNVKLQWGRHAYPIALLTALLWALNPIQTQAVTYIVQRMTSLAAIFYLAGIYFYTRGRLAVDDRRQHFGAAVLFFLLALGSKENTVLLPVALLLVEVLFFHDLSDERKRQRLYRLTAATVVLMLTVGAGAFLLFKGNPVDFFTALYTERPFSALERLMTEARIVVRYLTLIFYPAPERLSLLQDVTLSKSLFTPWTTLPAILTIGILLGLAVAGARRYPLSAFAIGFFFLNHLVESTIIPLELFFEHRNYLPSMFLFLPLAAGAVRVAMHSRAIRPGMHGVWVVLMAAAVITYGAGTYVRNMVWQSEKTLWEDVIVKAPGQARPYQKLAADYARRGELATALRLYTRALSLSDPRPEQSRNLSLNNIGNLYYRMGEFARAAEKFEAVLNKHPDNDRARYNLGLALLEEGRFATALTHTKILTTRNPRSVEFLNLEGAVLLHLQRAPEALQCFRRALADAPTNRNVLLNLGIAFKVLKDFRKADWFFRFADRLSPNDLMVQLRLIETNVLAGRPSAVDHYLERLFKMRRATEIESLLQDLSRQSRMLPFEHGRVRQAVAEKLRRVASQLRSNDRS